MIKAFAIILELCSSRRCIHLQNKTFTLLTGVLMIALTFDLDVAQYNGANMLLTKVLDSIILILFLTQLSPVTDAMEYVIRIVQKDLIVIIHTASIVSTLSYAINIRIQKHHGKTIFVLQVTLKITEAKMILLYLHSSKKIIQDISNFLLKEPNFELSLHAIWILP